MIAENLFRNILSCYRKIQYSIYERKRLGVLTPGILCGVEPFQFETNRGDVVHPCVRYIPEGFEGHNWWLVYTPYYNGDDSLENPILCFSDSIAKEPPASWKFYCEIQPRQKYGFNSDPTILFDNNQLYIFWRENSTPRTDADKMKRATYGCTVSNGKINEVFGPSVYTDDLAVDAETCPTFIKSGSLYLCYAMHLKFFSNKVRSLNRHIWVILERIGIVLDLLGIWSKQKHYGVAVWKADEIHNKFKYEKTIKFLNCNKLYRPWHMDLFEYESKLYAIVQSNQCNADILLAKMEGDGNFRLFQKPLITNDTIGKVGIYKPTGGVTADGIFYLYYTAQNNDFRALNKLYLTQMSFEKLLSQIQ